MTELQNRLADYNAVLNKMTSGTVTEDIEREMREIRELKDREEMEFEHIFQKREQAEIRLIELNKEIESRRVLAENNTDPEIKRKYDETRNEKIQIQKEIDALQIEYDNFSANRLKLKEEIALSPVSTNLFY